MQNVINNSKEIQVLLFLLPKILTATICGGIIGYERELKDKVAGLRTNILICVGTALFTACSVILSDMCKLSDPSRIISTILTGIGFLGAGVVMRVDDKIYGLTTASFIWVISAIGILIGMGGVLSPILITIGLFFTIQWLEKIERKVRSKRKD